MTRDILPVIFKILDNQGLNLEIYFINLFSYKIVTIFAKIPESFI